MDSRQLIDAQFNRAVEIVQSLPKTVPIQTGYEEKLTMYSLYKQATVGNVTTPRPGLFDMLGRAKWDAWAKHRDLDQYEAKWLYVDALLKALGKYSDEAAARDFINELRSYGGHYGNLVSSYTLNRTRSRGSSSSDSTASEDNTPIPPPYGHDLQHPSMHQHLRTTVGGEDSDDGEVGDESRDLPNISQQQRPLSSISFSSRYKTPLTGSLALASPPPRRTSVPPAQPLPPFETPSAFAGSPTPTPSAYTPPATYAVSLSSRDLAPRIRSAELPYRSFPTTSRHGTTAGAHIRPPSHEVSVSLEHAMENMQAHLAALTERIDTLESSLAHQQTPRTTSHPSRDSSGSGSSTDSRSVPQTREWDVDEMGLWTLVLKPLFQNLSSLQRFVAFFLTNNQDRSPLLIIVRRLCLDISFIMTVLGILRVVWVKTGTRRREVGVALVMLWGAVTGRKPPRIPGTRNLHM